MKNKLISAVVLGSVLFVGGCSSNETLAETSMGTSASYGSENQSESGAVFSSLTLGQKDDVIASLLQNGFTSIDAKQAVQEDAFEGVQKAAFGFADMNNRDSNDEPLDFTSFDPVVSIGIKQILSSDNLSFEIGTPAQRIVASSLPPYSAFDTDISLPNGRTLESIDSVTTSIQAGTVSHLARPLAPTGDMATQLLFSVPLTHEYEGIVDGKESDYSFESTISYLLEYQVDKWVIVDSLVTAAG